MHATQLFFGLPIAIIAAAPPAKAGNGNPLYSSFYWGVSPESTADNV